MSPWSRFLGSVVDVAGSGMTPLANAKPPAALQAVHDYAGLGGRVFLSHWHNIWVGGESGMPSHGLADWESIATFDFAAAQNETTQLTIVDENVAKGRPFATGC